MARKPLAPRSPKAGRPPAEAMPSLQVRRRRKTARAEVIKGQTVLETDHGPRALQAGKGPKVKKR